MSCSQLHDDRDITQKTVLLSTEKFMYLVTQHPYYFPSFHAPVLLTVLALVSNATVLKLNIKILTLNHTDQISKPFSFPRLFIS